MTIGVFGMLGFVDRAYNFGSSGTDNTCSIDLIQCNQTYHHSNDTCYDGFNLEEKIGDIQIIDHGVPYGSYGNDSDLYLDEYSKQQILEMAERIKNRGSLVPANQNIPILNDYGTDIKLNDFTLEDTYLAYDLRESFL